VDTINGVKVPLQYTKGEHGAGDGGAVAVVAFASIIGGIFMKGKMSFTIKICTSTRKLQRILI